MANNYKHHGTVAEHGKFLNGMSTGKNEAVLRYWFEISRDKLSLHSRSEEEFASTRKKFAPYNKGGEYRKWWGNQECVIAYDEESNEMMDSFIGHRHNNPDTYFHSCLSWSKISSGMLAMRYIPAGFVYDVAGCSLFCNQGSMKRYLLALYNSSIAMKYLQILSPTLNFEAGQIRRIPLILPANSVSKLIDDFAESSINLCRNDWDRFEASWGFTKHPLV